MDRSPLNDLIDRLELTAGLRRTHLSTISASRAGTSAKWRGSCGSFHSASAAANAGRPVAHS